MGHRQDTGQSLMEGDQLLEGAPRSEYAVCPAETSVKKPAGCAQGRGCWVCGRARLSGDAERDACARGPLVEIVFAIF